MEQIETANDWSSDDASDSQNSSSSSSDSEESQLAPRSQLRPAGTALTFVRHADWNPERSYEGERTIHWNMQWKLCLKKREQTGESELGIVISPRKFWKHVLQLKVTTATADKPWKEDDTKVVLSVTDRKTANITKRYPKLEVDWKYVSKQLQEWSKFLADGKKMTVTVTFYYQSVDAGKTGRGGATANQQADLEARTVGLERGACIRKAYLLMRCPGPPCTKASDHCWQNDGKHYPLWPHHVRMLADHMQEGKPLNGHDDVPEEFRRIVRDAEREREERVQKERDKTRKRRRRDSDGSAAGGMANPCLRCITGNGITPSIPHSPSLVFPTSPLIRLDLPREDAVREYSAWHQGQVGTEEQKKHYDTARELTLKECYDLNILTTNKKKMHRFYLKHGIPDGVAWCFVSGVKEFLEDRAKRARGA